MMSDTTSPSEEDHRSGLWLWHGKAPPPLPPLQPASRVQQIPGPTVSALRRRGWMALPGGVALVLLAVMLRSTPLDKPPPRIRPLWRSNQSLRPPLRMRSFPLLPSTSPHLGSSTWTPSSIRCKRCPRRLPYCQAKGQSTNWQQRRRTTSQREPRENPTHSPAEAHHSSSMECSRLRSRRSRATAVTEPFQQDDSRPDERARSRMLDRAALSLRPSTARRQGVFVASGRRARPSAAM